MPSLITAPLISVCVCSYRRPCALRECLDSVREQVIGVPFDVLVVDNDALCSAAMIVDEMRPLFAQRDIPFTYVTEPNRNIAAARNAAVAQSRGSLIAFIDDDEKADAGWLAHLNDTLSTYNAAAVIGAVVARFGPEIPVWMQRSGLFDRECPPTGTKLRAVQCRTGNVLGRRAVFELYPFGERLGRTGGSDVAFFRKIERAGFAICSCAESVVLETQEKRRSTLLWHVRRAYRSGWLYSYIRKGEVGLARAFLAALVSCFLGSGKVIWRSFAKSADVRTAALVLLSGLASQLGKVGFFISSPVEEYRER